MIQPHQRRQLTRLFQRLRTNSRADATEAVRANSIIIGDPGPSIGELAGDVVGLITHTIVEAIRGRPLLTIPPATGDALVWDGSGWGPGAPGAGSDPGGGQIIDYSTLVNEALVGRGAYAAASSSLERPPAAASDPTNAIDNTDATWHDTESGFAPAVPTPVEDSWLEVDLGVARDITWFRWMGQNAPTWVLQSSTDDIAWTDRYSGTGSGTILQDTGYVDLGGTFTARYWRIYALSGPADEATHYYPLRTFTLAIYSGAPLIQAPGHTIQDEGSNLAQRPTLNFTGAGVGVTDDSGADSTEVAIQGDLAYTHTQGSASASWTVAHALGKFPSVSVVSGGNLVYADVAHTDANNLTITFSAATSGVAYCN